MPCNNYPTDQAYDFPNPPQTTTTPTTIQTYPLRSWTLDQSGMDERVLIVSNAPETVTTGTGGYSLVIPSTLYKCEVPLIANIPKKVRVFFWHINQFVQDGVILPLKFQLLASTDGEAQAQISEHASEVRIQNTGAAPNVGDLSIPGICLAKSQLFGGLSSTTPNDEPLLLSTPAPKGQLALHGETILGSYDVGLATASGGQFMGTIHEFTVTSPVACNLRVRTVVTKHPLQHGDFSDTPVDAANPGGAHSTHIRGWWPRSELSLHCPSDPFDVGAVNSNGSSNIGAYGLIEPAGVESSAFTWQGAAIDPYGTVSGNKGLYGANVHYNVTVRNSRSTNRSLWMVIHSRNTGETFFGASETFGSDNGVIVSGGQYGIPVIKSDRITNSFLPVDQATLDPNETRDYRIDFASAGAAGLPVSLFVSGENPSGWRFNKNPPPP